MNASKVLSRLFIGTSVVALSAAAAVTSAQASVLELIDNGGFETGDLTDWTVTDQSGSDGTFGVIPNGDVVPDSEGHPTLTNPDGQDYVAVSYQNGPSANALSQLFTVPDMATQVSLFFDLFANNWYTTEDGVTTIVDPAGLHLPEDTEEFIPNQHARVDILKADADPLSTTPADILGNFYLGADPSDPNEDLNPFLEYSFDVTGLLTAGETYMLRFGQVDNEYFFNLGVDNVSVLATVPSKSVPEPATLGLMAIGLAGLGAMRRRKKA